MLPSDFDVLVVGHLCLDIIPELRGEVSLKPGVLVEAGPAQLSPGGAVANVGTILSRLGVRTKMVAKVGADPFGDNLLRLLAENAPTAIQSISRDPDQPTSYTIVMNLAGVDRTFLHCPGANREFRSVDVSDDDLRRAKFVHLGYPPLLEALYQNEGRELADLLSRAKRKGAQTSLDLSFPDQNSASGRADWKTILANALPFVDYFLPSLDELAFMLGREVKPAQELDLAQTLAHECNEIGAKNVGIKLGELGLYYFAGGQEHHHPCFQVPIQGTTGSGDATIAGFLAGILADFSVPERLRLACATGAACCLKPDAVSGVVSREQVELMQTVHAVTSGG